MSADMSLDDYEWQPPSEAEMKVLQARRERSDKISQIMGEYLLKGYKMLGSSCDICETILLETTSGEKYCIACRELEEETEKDNPIFQAEHLQPKVELQTKERSDAICKLLGDYLLKGYKMLESVCPDCDTILLQDRSKNDMCVCCEIIDKKEDQVENPVLNTTTNNIQSDNPGTSRTHQDIKKPIVSSQCCTLSNTQDVLRHKIVWATEQLQGSQTIDYNIVLCTLIKTAADAISSIQNIK